MGNVSRLADFSMRTFTGENFSSCGSGSSHWWLALGGASSSGGVCAICMGCKLSNGSFESVSMSSKIPSEPCRGIGSWVCSGGSTSGDSRAESVRSDSGTTSGHSSSSTRSTTASITDDVVWPSSTASGTASGAASGTCTLCIGAVMGRSKDDDITSHSGNLSDECISCMLSNGSVADDDTASESGALSCTYRSCVLSSNSMVGASTSPDGLLKTGARMGDFLYGTPSAGSIDGDTCAKNMDSDSGTGSCESGRPFTASAVEGS
mmetsp:Transcript_119152/g.206891  ORF Transcript_119152/g.206891 Transcript_119152/m.206891 type:complete len:264 (+) Transcript_119152:1612-2403(+)